MGVRERVGMKFKDEIEILKGWRRDRTAVRHHANLGCDSKKDGERHQFLPRSLLQKESFNQRAVVVLQWIRLQTSRNRYFAKVQHCTVRCATMRKRRPLAAKPNYAQPLTISRISRRPVAGVLQVVASRHTPSMSRDIAAILLPAKALIGFGNDDVPGSGSTGLSWDAPRH